MNVMKLQDVSSAPRQHTTPSAYQYSLYDRLSTRALAPLTHSSLDCSWSDCRKVCSLLEALQSMLEGYKGGDEAARLNMVTPMAEATTNSADKL
jgi:hypothetical protein